MDKKITDGVAKRWTTLGSKYVINRPWLTARCDRMRLANGVVIDEYYVLEYPEWVNIIAVTTEGQYVMVRQYRHGIGVTSCEICAGCCEPGEAPEDAARRELLEETGYAGGEWHKLMVTAPNATSMNNYTHCFVATGVEKVSDCHLDATEELEVFLLSEDELFELLSTDRIVQATMAVPLWKYFYTRRLHGQ